MTKREIKRQAHGIVYAIIQSAIDAGIAALDDNPKLESALSDLAQRHFELSDIGKQKCH